MRTALSADAARSTTRRRGGRPYAVECLRALGIRLRHAVRLFYGCSEEDMMNDVLYYGEKVGLAEIFF